jgi:hypothetical protein
LSNTDPLKLGRIKVFIPGFLEGEVDELPWMFPDAVNGGQAEKGSIDIPEVNDLVRIVFPTRDVYAGFYTGPWMSDVVFPGDYRRQYPEATGSRDPLGNRITHNKAKGTTRFDHNSGSYAEFKADGTVVFSGKKAITFKSADGASEFTYDFETGTVSQTPSEKTEVGGNEHNVNSAKVNVSTGELNEEITGAQNKEVIGGRKVSVGGDESKAVTGNKATTVAGKTTALHTDEHNATFGAGRKETVITGGDEETILEGDKKVQIAIGNFIAQVIAGNIDLTTEVGAATLGNLIGSLVIDAVGNLTAKGLTATVEGEVMATVKAPLLLLNSGSAPMVSVLTDPLEDFITGKPKIGIPTILGGP